LPIKIIYVNKVEIQVRIAANSRDDEFILEIVKNFTGNKLGGDRAITKLKLNDTNGNS